MAKTTAPSTARETSELAEQIRHRDGCPEERIETYTATNPERRAIEVARCVDCGEAIYE